MLPAHAGVVPPRDVRPRCPVGAPRARGGGPTRPITASTAAVCSPRTRGWSQLPQVLAQGSACAPRARGGGPSNRRRGACCSRCSPRTRGWSHRRVGAVRGRRVLPAHAGVVPRHNPDCHCGRGAPRTRGDGPSHTVASSSGKMCSPHARGWSHRSPSRPCPTGVLPARAGMVPVTRWAKAGKLSAPRTRGDGPFPKKAVCVRLPCSPHARGWSRSRPRRSRPCRVLPARAGMVPRYLPLPAHGARAPRTRGDGPDAETVLRYEVPCSPHARGWSLCPGTGPCPGWVLPARAGMVPHQAWTAFSTRSAPRTRGDGPQELEQLPSRFRCSPHARGWSRHGQAAHDARRVLPARVGMVPCPSWHRCPTGSAPRTRGDGPRDHGPCGPAGLVLPARGDGPRAEKLLRESGEVLPARSGTVRSVMGEGWGRFCGSTAVTTAM